MTAARAVGAAVREMLTPTVTILIVDDSAAMRRLASEILKRAGYRTLVAADAAEALQICESHAEPIELLLSDVMMPGMNGRELADRARAVRSNMKVLLMSGHTEDVLAEQGAHDPSLSFLQKPITPRALAAKVKEVLEG
jgi:two-component system, cell cycle sensor histidine kinase and response regulator CckA